MKKTINNQKTVKASERDKTQAQQAEDIAYTINHSLYCTLTDFINPPVNAATDGYLRWLIPGCGHDHSGGHAQAHSPSCDVAATYHVHTAVCGHHVHLVPKPVMPKKLPTTIFDVQHLFDLKMASKATPAINRLGDDFVASLKKSAINPPAPHVHHTGCTHDAHVAQAAAHICSHGHFHAPEGISRWEKVKLASQHAFSKERFIQYAKGEFIGDFGAVPITIAAQRLFPGMMRSIRRITEPLAKPLFDFGIEQSSKRWAKREGVEVGSDAFKQHKKDVYEHEMNHFPQAVVWTGASLGLNVAYQMFEDKQTQAPFFNKLALKTGSVLSGVAVTASIVVAARALAPHKVREFDQWTSQHAILPLTRSFGRITGMYDESAVDRMLEKQLQPQMPALNR